MGHHLIARHPVGHRASHRCDHAGGLNTKRHRLRPTDIPAAGADELIPVANAGRHDLDQHFVVGEETRLRSIDDAGIAADAANSRYEHCRRPNASLPRRTGRPSRPVTCRIACLLLDTAV
jgi:hypothetical protein